MRFTPHTPKDRTKMLEAIGVSGIEDLFSDLPQAIRLTKPLNLPPGMAELELTRHLKKLAAQNFDLDQYTSFLGAGAYDRFIPAAVDQILSRSEFYTAYTPYQPEVSQGTLQSIFEFQTMICELTGLEAANASTYDGATAMAEAGLMAAAQTRRSKVLVSRGVHPEYRWVLQTYLAAQNIEVTEVPLQNGTTDLKALNELLDGEAAGLVLANPNFLGNVETEIGAAFDAAHARKALAVAVVDPVSLAILAEPSSYGADIAVGEGQSLGNPVSFGGPYLGFMATTSQLLRRLPGRIAGQTTDEKGRRGFVLTLQAREQHIRREKAASNICSNEALCALAATVYLSLLGKQGLRQVAEQSLKKAHYAQKRLTELPGVEATFNGPFFQEFVVKLPVDGQKVNDHLLRAGIIGGLNLGAYYPELKGHQLICVTERRTKTEIDTLVEMVGELL